MVPTAKCTVPDSSWLTVAANLPPALSPHTPTTLLFTPPAGDKIICKLGQDNLYIIPVLRAVNVNSDQLVPPRIFKNDVVLTSMRRDYVASTSIRRHFGTKYPLKRKPLNEKCH